MDIIVTLVAVALIAALIKILHGISSKRRFWQCLEKIPQPPTYPIIGNLMEILQTPENLFLSDRARGKEFFPIYKLVIIDKGNVNLLNPEDIELVLNNMKHITKSLIYDPLHAWLGTGLLTSDGAKWQKRRKILTPAFHFNILGEFVKVFNNETETLVENLKEESKENGGVIDVVPPITQFALWSIEETAMGMNLTSEEKASYKSSIYKLGKLLLHRIQRPWLYSELIYALTSEGRASKKVIQKLHDVSRHVIKERKGKKQAESYSTRKRLAMLDLLLKHQAENGDIDDEGIREEVDTFMFEGHDTTSMAICFTLMILANHPKIQDQVVEEIQQVLADGDTPSYNELQELKFMERCIKESLRLYPSVPFISRISGEEIQTKTGHTIPKDCMINMHIYDMHHNKNVFPDPEKFDPDRFLMENIKARHPFAYLPFSAGPRNCIGQKFAILEMKTVLCGILRKFILEPVDTPSDIVFVSDLVLRPKNPVKVKFTPRLG